jgi:hypothetical protein
LALRLHIGLEDPVDLLADLRQALDNVRVPPQPQQQQAAVPEPTCA